MSENRPSILWYYDSKGVLQYTPFLATVEEKHSGKATVSKYPVQNGFEVSNHMIRHNRVITISVLAPEAILGGLSLKLTETASNVGGLADNFLGTDIAGVTTIIGGVAGDPLGVAGNYLDGAISSLTPVAKGIASAVDTATGWLPEGFNTSLSDSIEESNYLPSSSRRIALFDSLRYIQEKGILCSLSTVLHDYTNLALVNYDAPTNLETLSTAAFELTFEELLVVDSEGVAATNLNPSGATEEEKKKAIERASKVSNSPARNKLGELFA